MEPEKDNQVPVTDNTMPNLDASPTPSAEPTPSPLSNEAPAQIAPAPEKKSKKGLIIVISIIALLLIAAAVYFGLVFLNSTKTTPPKDDDSTATQQSALSKLGQSATLALSGTISKKENQTGPSYSLTDDAYFTVPGDDAEIFQAYSVVDSEETMLTDKAAVEKVLTNNNLKVIATYLDGSESTNYDAKWASEAFVCDVSAGGDNAGATYNETLKKYVYTSYTNVVVCANVSDYTAPSNEMEPFFAAFKKATPDAKGIVLAGLKVTDSKTEGYKTATISMHGQGAYTGGYVGLYYQTPDKAWHFFKGTQQGLACSSYDTDDLKKAYLGEDCYEGTSGTANSTVKL